MYIKGRHRSEWPVKPVWDLKVDADAALAQTTWVGMACEARLGFKGENTRHVHKGGPQVGMACEARLGFKGHLIPLTIPRHHVGMACEARLGFKEFDALALRLAGITSEWPVKPVWDLKDTMRKRTRSQKNKVGMACEARLGFKAICAGDRIGALCGRNGL